MMGRGDFRPQLKRKQQTEVENEGLITMGTRESSRVVKEGEGTSASKVGTEGKTSRERAQGRMLTPTRRSSRIYTAIYIMERSLDESLQVRVSREARKGL